MRSLVLGLLALVLGGCTLGRRAWLPNVPVRGQTATQVQRDKDECTATAKEALSPFAARLGKALIPLAGYAETSESDKLENAYRTCMTERGYQVKP